MNWIFVALCLLVGIPGLLVPRQLQRMTLSHHGGTGRSDRLDAFRRSPRFVFWLRVLGGFTIVCAAVVVFAEEIARVVF